MPKVCRVNTQDPIDQLGARAQRVDVPWNDGAVVWRCWGEGPPLVLLHGGHGSWLHWLRNIDALAQSHSVWVPDMPGYGDSVAPAQPGLDALLEGLNASLDALLGPAAPMALAGFSFGGLVAAHLAGQRANISRLALLGAAGHGGARRPRGKLLPWKPAHVSGDTEALRTVMRHNLLVHMLSDESQADDTAVRIHTRSCVQTRFHSRSISQSGGLLDALNRYAGPTLLLWGEHDVTATPTELLHRLSAASPKRQSEVVAGAGHWLPYEAAGIVNARLLGFFK